MKRLFLFAAFVALGVRAQESERPARWSVDALGGGWTLARSDGSGRSLEPAYGARLGFAFDEGRLEADLRAARATEAAGSAFVSASASHELLSLRVAAVQGRGRLALLAGLGAGAALTRSRASLQDVTGPRVERTASLTQPTFDTFVAVRFRLFRVLEGRGELDFLFRNGRLEWLPNLGLGAAF